jgi:hypothetical protein
MTDHDPFAELDREAAAAGRGLREHVLQQIDVEGGLGALPIGSPRVRRGRILAVAAAAALLVGAVAVTNGDDRSQVRVDLDEALPDVEPGLLRPLGPRDGKSSIQLPLTVEPSTGLHDGQTVTVSATGFVPGESVGLVQCAKEAGGETPETRGGIDGCLIDPYVSLTADDDGSVTGEYEVRRVLTTPLTGTVDCAADANRCIVAMGALNDYDRSGGHAIEFAPGGEPIVIPAVTVTPTQGLGDGDLVHVTADHLTPDSFVTIEVCSNDPVACWQTGELTTVEHDEAGEDYTEHLIGLPADGDGHLEGDLPVWRYLPGGEPGTYVDCAVSRCALRLSGETAPPTVPLAFTPGGDGPEAPTVVVDPADELAPGDEVLVRGVGFAPGGEVWISLCARPVGEEAPGYGTCASSQGGPDTVEEDGTFAHRFEIPEMGRLDDYYASEGCTDEGCTAVTQAWAGEEIRCDGVVSACEILAEVMPYTGSVATPPVFYAAPAPITFR